MKKFTTKEISNDCSHLFPDAFSKDTGKGFNTIVIILNDMENSGKMSRGSFLTQKSLKKLKMAIKTVNT